MKRWVAERGSDKVDNREIWRDEDVAMATERHVMRDEDAARTMLVGMIMTEAWGWYELDEDHTRLNMYTDGARAVADCRVNTYVNHGNGVYFRIREFD